MNGKPISEREVVSFVKNHKEEMVALGLSFFEMTTAMAFNHFSENNVEVAVIETGLGGRLDSTNIISPILSVITNIGLDHTALLGSTIGEIAFEKAGIIKPEVPVVVGESELQHKKHYLDQKEHVLPHSNPTNQEIFLLYPLFSVSKLHFYCSQSQQ